MSCKSQMRLLDAVKNVSACGMVEVRCSKLRAWVLGRRDSKMQECIPALPLQGVREELKQCPACSSRGRAMHVLYIDCGRESARCVFAARHRTSSPDGACSKMV